MEVAESAGVPAYLINDIEDIKREWLAGVGVAVIGLTAGASAPQIRALAKLATTRGSSREIETTRPGS